jgi:glycosyltransferase involved in cell wall biosynthesis
MHPHSWRDGAPPHLNVLHIQYWTPITLPILLTAAYNARRANARIVVTVHNTQPHENIPGITALEERLLKRCDRLIIHHESLCTPLLERGIDVPVSVIPHGVSLGQPPGCCEVAPPIKPAGKYVLAFGNVRPYKGLEVLLEAWERIGHQFPGYELVVAGRLWSGGRNPFSMAVGQILGMTRYARGLRERLEQAERTGRVRFMNGFLEDEELDTLIAGATVTAFPYRRFSAQSGAACRAAGQGTPLLVTNVGALAHLVPDQETQVARPNDPCDLASKLSALLQSLERSSEIRSSQFEHIRRFAWNRIAEQHARLYHELLAQGE